MTHYLLDTNICIHFMRNSFNMAQRIEEVGWQHLSISEITVAELYFMERKGAIILKRTIELFNPFAVR